ncbi:type IV conjugative transfer system protein TraL [Burkholderia pseudomallei]|uniref:type IV conjugative transfer system protein TraL n=1 Tax=Burkholderia TaxID=32008 RepID=UPI0007579811|nr:MULTISPECIES: type IV conjugative transfer system protein TraL [Burkholderia]KWH59303.1 conjugal transfer protein TraL [Burkholderia cepacia]MCV9914957.1 type IV conjugative transfer system protein TraL [Burkholderia pseudomallei]MCW0070995.1 type IV conjugative transfer system protein TraL [Burkholderia pseudomallei]TCW75576.1 type IV conjugative transfer system protein TraL [Burkholderia sp. SRS-46]
MAAEDLSHAIPVTLDDAPKLLFWDWDVAMVVMTGITVGLGTGYPILGVALGFGLAAVYSKFFKAGTHQGAPFHLLGWMTGQPPMSDLPDSYLRDFQG